MDLFIYSDESGVFDYAHNKYFVFAGVICFGIKQRDDITRKYKHFEDVHRQASGCSPDKELKACKMKNATKGKAYRSLNQAYKFCVVIEEGALLQNVYSHKKHKQRYLDFAYKMVLKRCLSHLINSHAILPEKIHNIYVYCDEHSTATDGRYELEENLRNEFKLGTFNMEYNRYYEPIFPGLANVFVHFCDSKKVILVRAADIIANRCYYLANKGHGRIEPEDNLFLYYLPANTVGGDESRVFPIPKETESREGVYR